VNIVTSKPSLAYPDHGLHETERVVGEISADANGKDRWGKTKVANHADEPRPANAPRKPYLHPSNNKPMTGPGAS
jgi:hypothetical protein